MANVILSTLGTGGDVYPFLLLGKKLRANGHQVALVSSSIYASAAQRIGIDFVAIDDLSSADALIRDGQLLNNSLGLMQFFSRHIVPRIVPEIEAIRALCRPGTTILVARLMPCIGAAIAARLLKIPLVGVALAPAHVNGLNIFIELLNFSFGSNILSICERYGLDPIDNWSSLLNFAHILGYWPEWFAECSDHSPAGLHALGFLPSGDLLTENQDAVTLRRLEGPPVLISCGTGYFGIPNFIRFAAEGCRAAKCSPVVVCPVSELIPQDLPTQTIVLNHVPSLPDLMRHMVGVCHHGGMGTISDAIFAGVPQVIVAGGGDRPDNARRLSRLGVAWSVPPHSASAKTLSDAISAAISSPMVYNKCLSLSRSVNPSIVLSKSCEIIESALGGIQDV